MFLDEHFYACHKIKNMKTLPEMQNKVVAVCCSGNSLLQKAGESLCDDGYS